MDFEPGKNQQHYPPIMDIRKRDWDPKNDHRPESPSSRHSVVRLPSVSSLDDSIQSSTVSDDTQSDDSVEKKTIFGVPEELFNVFLMGIGFMFNIGALNAGLMVQTVVLNSVKDEYFEGTPTLGYQLLAINCVSQAVAYLLGCSLSSVIGPKFVLVAGSVTISIYLACFLRPLLISLYIGTVILGFGYGGLWCVQGFFIFINSDSGTVERNMAIFWGFLQTGAILANLFYSLMLHGSDAISDWQRIVVYAALLGSSVVGTISLSFIRYPWFSTDNHSSIQLATPEGNRTRSRLSVFGKALSHTLLFFRRKEILLLLPHFAFIGVECTFWANVYGTSMGYTKAFGNIRLSIVGLNGTLFGVGEIIASVFLMMTGRWSFRKGRDLLLMLGFIISAVVYFLIFLNLPDASPLGPTEDQPFLGPSPYLALFSSALLGIADALWTNQLMSYLSCTFPTDCIAVFGVYQFVCALANSASFWYSTVLELSPQLLVLVLTTVPAAAGFCLNEWNSFRAPLL